MFSLQKLKVLVADRAM